MRFQIASLLAFASAVLAQTAGFDAITNPTKDEQVSAGSTYPVVWQFDSQYAGTVTLKLLGGATPSTLQVLSTISAGVDNSAGTFAWSVPASLGDLETYGIQIVYDKDTSVFQYSFPFHIKAGSGAATSSATSSATSASEPAKYASETTTSGAVTTSSAPVTSESTITTPAANSTTPLTTTSYTHPAHNATTTAAPVTTPATTTYGNHTKTAPTTTAKTTLTTLSSSSSSSEAASSTSEAASSTPATVSPSSTPSTVNTNGAASAGASLVALIGGLAVAVFAL